MIPLVVVSVGTDHHPFDRLVQWTEDWFAAPGHPSVNVLIQYGTAAPPRTVAGRDYLPHRDLQTILSRACAVVTHGGPATIGEAWRAGHRPLVVPRERRLGEHVDDHQLAFASKLHELGSICYIRSRAALGESLDRLIASPGSGRLARPPERLAEQAADTLATLVQGLVGQRRPSRIRLRGPVAPRLPHGLVPPPAQRLDDLVVEERQPGERA